MVTALIIVLILIAVGAFPGWSYSRSWNHGYTPSGAIVLLVLILLVLSLTGRI